MRLAVRLGAGVAAVLMLGALAACGQEGRFTYTVEVTLDGRAYVGTGEWPTDTNPEIVPHVPLTWEPALPVYAG